MSDTSLAKISISFPSIPNINKNAVATVSAKLPELSEKTKMFDRSNSQTTLSLMTLTMMNGQSPMRILRQVLAEVDRKKMALAEAQLHHAEKLEELEKLYSEESTPVIEAKIRLCQVSIDSLEGKVNGVFKDIATLIDAYESIKAKHNIQEWDEKTFEDEEKKHHIRRGFELLYRNILQNGRAHESSIEYLQQYGVHIQIALAEVMFYINTVNENLKEGKIVTASNIEDFLDAMSEKYKNCADEASERLFGKADFANSKYMSTGEQA